MEAVAKWRKYLLGKHFIICTDQKSLKELLTQVIQTPNQQQYLCKLMGYQFSIEYKAGSENSVADALSRRHDTPNIKFRAAMLAGKYDFLDELRKENMDCADLKVLQQQSLTGNLIDSQFSIRDGILKESVHDQQDVKIEDLAALRVYRWSR